MSSSVYQDCSPFDRLVREAASLGGSLHLAEVGEENWLAASHLTTLASSQDHWLVPLRGHLLASTLSPRPPCAGQ